MALTGVDAQNTIKY